MKPIRLYAAASVVAACVMTLLALQSTQAQTYKLLYSFQGPPDGSNPYAGLIHDAKGNLYGTTRGGGASGPGTAFALSKTGKETVLYSFTGGADGAYPLAGLFRDSKGSLYGTTEGTLAGNNCSGYACGNVFKLSKAGKETVLHTFCSEKNCTDGFFPFAGLIQDAKGNLYGTTELGGSSTICSGYGCGVVFKLSKTGVETVLHSFCVQSGCADGAIPPVGSLIQDAKGNLYGTTNQGGAYGWGTVFKLSSTGKEKVLYSFKGGSDGSNPFAGVIQDAKGNLFGTTYSGGAYNAGTVFKLSKTGQETVLYSFKGGDTDGANPSGGVSQDNQGNLYGTTYYGGASGAGTVFKVSKTGPETVLHSFEGGDTDGANPSGGVFQDSKGNLYGTTQAGGGTGCDNYGCGVVFKLTP